MIEILNVTESKALSVQIKTLTQSTQANTHCALPQIKQEGIKRAYQANTQPKQRRMQMAALISSLACHDEDEAVPLIANDTIKPLCGTTTIWFFNAEWVVSRIGFENYQFDSFPLAFASLRGGFSLGLQLQRCNGISNKNYYDRSKILSIALWMQIVQNWNGMPLHELSKVWWIWQLGY